MCGTETDLCRLLIRSGTNISWCHRVDDEHTVNESQEDRNQERNETDETLATEGTNRNNEDSEVLHELVRWKVWSIVVPAEPCRHCCHSLEHWLWTRNHGSIILFAFGIIYSTHTHMDTHPHQHYSWKIKIIVTRWALSTCDEREGLTTLLCSHSLTSLSPWKPRKYVFLCVGVCLC